MIFRYKLIIICHLSHVYSISKILTISLICSKRQPQVFFAIVSSNVSTPVCLNSLSKLSKPGCRLAGDRILYHTNGSVSYLRIKILWLAFRKSQIIFGFLLKNFYTLIGYFKSDMLLQVSNRCSISITPMCSFARKHMRPTE